MDASSGKKSAAQAKSHNGHVKLANMLANIIGNWFNTYDSNELTGGLHDGHY
jgi:hypothetical protein